mgnify:CR=1 FL=1
MLIQIPQKPGRLPACRRGAILLAIIGGIAVLGACAPRTELWSPVESPKRNTVHWAAFHHNVGFASDSADLNEEQRRAVAAFLGRIARGDDVRIALAAHKNTPSRLALRRETTLAAFLRQRGYRVTLGEQTADVGTLPGSVHVTVGRYVLTAPRCPDWSKPATGDPANRVSGNFRCADATNFGLMLADPGVLANPEPTGPMDGEMAARAINDYRKDKTKKPPQIVIQTGG